MAVRRMLLCRISMDRLPKRFIFILSEGDCSEKQKVYIGFTQQKGNLADKHENTQPCHPEGGEAESRDLGTDLTIQLKISV